MVNELWGRIDHVDCDGCFDVLEKPSMAKKVKMVELWQAEMHCFEFVL